MIMDGFVFGPGPEGRCDEMRVGGGVVDYDAVGDQWRLWCYCRDRALHERAPKTLGSGRIALATSPDGVTWTRVEGPLTGGSVFEPSDDPAAFDSLHVGLTDMSRGAGEWLMWYFGGDASLRATTSPLGAVVGLGLRPGLARSADGVNWRRVKGPTPSGALFDHDEDHTYAGWPNVFHDGARFVMQYSAPDRALDLYTTLTAVSDDGVHWRQTGPLRWADGPKPWDCTGIITRQVLPNPLPEGGRFLMIYTGTNAEHARSIAAAHSDDGLSWTHLYDGPVFGVGEASAWDSTGVAATRLVPARGRLHLYYYGFQSLADNGLPRGIGLAVNDDLDLRRLVRIKSPL
jgi:hypothetical protein